MTRRRKLLLSGGIIGGSILIFLSLREIRNETLSPVTTVPPSSRVKTDRARPKNVSEYEISSRGVDAAQPAYSWISSGFDAKKMTTALDESEEMTGLLIADYDKWGVFDGWAGGHAEDGDFRDKISACVAKYEGLIDPGCSWDHDIVVSRTGPQSGKVVAYRIRMDPGADQDRECRAEASCIERAWRGRSAPMPKGDDDMLALSTFQVTTNVSGAKGKPCDTRIRIYEEQLIDSAKYLVELVDRLESDNSTFADVHNHRLEVVSRKHMIAVLEAVRDSC